MTNVMGRLKWALEWRQKQNAHQNLKLIPEAFSTLNSLSPLYLWEYFSTQQIEYDLRIKELVEH